MDNRVSNKLISKEENAKRLLKTKLFMKENGLLVLMLDREKEYKSGRMALVTKDGGMAIEQMAEEDSFMLITMYMKGNGLMIKLKGGENIHILMVQCMKVLGEKINKMEMVLRIGLMELVTEVLMSWVKRKARDNSFGVMAVHIMAISPIIIFMGKDFISGLTEDNMMANGWTTKCMVMEYSLG